MHDLRMRICDRHGSVHRFCRTSGLPRSTVYQVLAGRYGGHLETQRRRIEAALGGVDPRVSRVVDAIAGVACARCGGGPKRCQACQDLFHAQALAALEVV